MRVALRGGGGGVASANALYSFVAKAIVQLETAGILWSVENPTNSLFWLTSPVIRAKEELEQLLRARSSSTSKPGTVSMHMCMHDGDRNRPLFQTLSRIPRSGHLCIRVMRQPVYRQRPGRISGV